MRGVKPETKITVIESQVRDKAKNDIRVIVNRTRSAAKAKIKVNP